MKRDSVVVVGGINCDITASVAGHITPGSSTPGRVGLSPGGVGRNIAHGLALLGVPVSLVGRAGDDPLSGWVLRETAAAGVDTTAVDRATAGSPGMYVSLLRDGELEAAVADMAAIEGLSPDAATDLLAVVARRQRPAAVVVDLNLPPGTVGAVIRWANEREIPVIVEPVSVAKAQRLVGVGGQIEVVTPNVAEAMALQAAPGPLPQIEWWVVTRGRLGAGLIHREWSDGGAAASSGVTADGAGRPTVAVSASSPAELPDVAATPGEAAPPPSRATVFSPRDGAICRLIPARPVTTRNANGAGDALVAGFVAGFVAGLDVPTATRWGIAAGTITAAAEGSVAAELSRAAVVRAAGKLPSTGDG